MTSTLLTIKDEDTAWDYIKSALSGSFEDEIIELDFSSWPVFKLNVKGDRYHSTITAPMMRSLLELQTLLNRLYAEVAYGKSAKALTNEERKEIELVFTVHEGSSDIVADLSGFFTELGKSAMDKLTGRQIAILVIGAAAILGGSSVYDSYLDYSLEAQKEANRSSLEMQLTYQAPQLNSVANDKDAFYNNLLKSVSDADEVTVAEQTLTRYDIQALTSSERQVSELKRIDDHYLISSLKVKPDSYRVEITRIEDNKSIQAELFKGHLGMEDMDRILQAFRLETPLHLKVTARVRSDSSITAGNIVGIYSDEQLSSVEPSPPPTI